MSTANCGKPRPGVRRKLWIPCPQHSGIFKGVVQVRIAMMTAMTMMVVGLTGRFVSIKWGQMLTAA